VFKRKKRTDERKRKEAKKFVGVKEEKKNCPVVSVDRGKHIGGG